MPLGLAMKNNQYRACTLATIYWEESGQKAGYCPIPTYRLDPGMKLKFYAPETEPNVEPIKVKGTVTSWGFDGTTQRVIAYIKPLHDPDAPQQYSP